MSADYFVTDALRVVPTECAEWYSATQRFYDLADLYFSGDKTVEADLMAARVEADRLHDIARRAFSKALA